MKQSRLFENVGDTYIVVVFFVSLMISVMAFLYEKQRNYDFGAAQFNEEISVIGHNLQATFSAYAQVLRSGVVLFQATDQVDRQIWQDYIANLQLERKYPEIQGVSFNALLHSPEGLAVFQRRIQQEDLSSCVVRPGGQQDLYVPILYLEPSVGANRAALGFDIYSEAIRRTSELVAWRLESENVPFIVASGYSSDQWPPVSIGQAAVSKPFQASLVVDLIERVC